MKLIINGELNPKILKTKDDRRYYGGYLDLSGTGITSLPDNLSVGGSLDLRGTGITSLPDNLSVGGYLDLRGTGITSLPDNLSVGDSLYLGGTGITNYPVVYDCGDEDRAIYLDLEDKRLIHIGCFVGNETEAVHAIKEKYTGIKADSYIAKVRECYQIWENMQEVTAKQA